MSFTAEYDSQNKIITVEFTGKVNQEVIIRYSKAASDLASQHNCKKILLDLRNATINFTTLEIFNLPSLLSSHGLDRSFRRAILPNDQIPDLRFFENVANNRGFLIRIFKDKQKALEWL